MLQTNGISQGKRRRNFTMRLRSTLPVSYTKAKHIGKRVRNQLLEFENLSERNSKHLYIERCRALPGYDCTFFSVRVPSAGRFRKSPAVKQLLGVSNRSVVFLDEKTKVCMCVCVCVCVCMCVCVFISKNRYSYSLPLHSPLLLPPPPATLPSFLPIPLGPGDKVQSPRRPVCLS